MNGTILWGQPEILFYVLPPCEDARCGIGYPDYVETPTEIYITETDKALSRWHLVPSKMLSAMWQQLTLSEVAQTALVTNVTGSSGLPPQMPAPSFGNLQENYAFTVEVVFTPDRLYRRNVTRPVPLLDCRAPNGKGVAIEYTQPAASPIGGPGCTRQYKVNVSICDGNHSQSFDTDTEAQLWSAGPHHIVFVVDGASRTITSVVNGVFADGGYERSQGWAHLGTDDLTRGDHPQLIGDVGGAASCSVHSSLTLARIYDRGLLTSEAIGNWRAWKAGGA